MKIIDNFFNQQDQDFIEKLLFIEENFPWYLAHTSNYTYEDYVDAIKENVGLPFEKEYHQFVHTFYGNKKQNSNHWPYFEKIFKSNKHIEINNFFRVKANLNVQVLGSTKDTHGMVHRDHPKNILKSILYYVNDTDGDTLLFDNSKNLIEKINPKKGRAVIFDSNSLHAASPPFNSKIRVVINCIIYKKNTLNDSTNK